MTLLGVDGVFISRPVQKNTLPEGFCRYELSGVSSDQFTSVGEKAKTRYAGDFISKSALPLGIGKQKKLKESDWAFDRARPFDFEAFWGQKLSIDKMIENANYKRELAMGQGKSDRSNRQSSPLEHSEHLTL